jgi:hypothetical protein
LTCLLINLPAEYLFVLSQNSGPIDARGGTYNDVGQDQHNCYVTNNYFYSDLKNFEAPVGISTIFPSSKPYS